jgi:hypothetical protein
MRILKTVLLPCLILMLSSVEAKDAKAKGPYLGIKDFKYTNEQIENLKSTQEYENSKYQLLCSRYSIRLSAAKKEEIGKKKVSPFRIGVYVKKDGKKIFKGNGEIYIIDTEKKKVVTSTKMSLLKLCPS